MKYIKCLFYIIEFKNNFIDAFHQIFFGYINFKEQK